MNIKERIKQSGFRQWEVAEKMGISEFTLSRYLRRPDRMPADRIKKIEAALSKLENTEGS